MRLAIPIFRSRVSPVFDFSTRALIVDTMQGKEIGRHEVNLAGLSSQSRVERLKDVEVNTIICAGISLNLQRMLAIAGLKVIPGIVGSVDEILKAYHRGNLNERRFMMPGFCYGRCRRRRGWHGHK